jgi:hypothetical protein
VSNAARGQIAPEEQDPEAVTDDLDEDDEIDFEDYSEPLHLQSDDRRLITQPYDYSIQQLVDELGRGKIRLDIEYQRKYVWDNGKASRLVESLLLNVPIPVCYFAEDDDFNFEVIDGLQRITSLRRFFENDFALTGITVLKEVLGKKYRELAPRDQRRLASRTIRCVAITADSNPDIKFDVFERLNTNVAVLTAQELRNCVYRGTFNNALKAQAKYDPLNSLIGGAGSRRMVGEELVLRFLALNDGLQDYRPPLRQFLNTYMRNRRNKPIAKKEKVLIERCLDIALNVFGADSFRLPDKAGRARPTLNKALYDAFMISIAYADAKDLAAKRDELPAIVPDLLKDDTFRASLGRATANRKRVFGRIRRVSLELEKKGVQTRALDIVGREEPEE